MKIATFNINGINKRLGNLLDWLAETEPDVVCLQELKAAEPDFPAAAVEAAGYGAVWRGQRAWNGVAILARGAEPILTREALPGDEADRQPRYIEAAVQGVLVASLYAPNGNPQPGPKFAYKLAWMERLHAHAAGLIAAGVPVVLAGDYNVTPEPRDVYPTKSYDGNALNEPEPQGGLCAAAGAGVDGRAAGAAPGGRALHLLGLPAEPLGARRGDAARPPAPEPRARRAAGSGGGRPGGARAGERQRPCADMGAAEGGVRRRRFHAQTDLA